MLVTLLVILSAIGQAGPATASSQQSSDFWKRYIAPATQPAGADVVLLEGVPIIKAVEGFDPALAALASVLDYQLADRLPSGGDYPKAPEAGSELLQRADKRQGRQLTRQEAHIAARAVMLGPSRAKLKEAFSEYQAALDRARDFRATHFKLVPTAGQARMAVLRELTHRDFGTDPIGKTIKEFKRLRHVSCDIHDVRSPDFDAIWADLKQGVPGILVSKAGTPYVVVGAVRDASAAYVICADPAQIEVTALPGDALMPKVDRDSTDPDVRKYVEASRKVKMLRDFVVNRADSAPAGMAVVAFGATNYIRWFSCKRWVLDVAGFEDIERELDRVIANPQETVD